MSPVLAVPTLVICEAAPRWSVAWRRAVAGQSIRVKETRSWSAVTEALMQPATAWIGVEAVAEKLPPLVAQIASWEREHANIPILVFGTPELRAAEWALRDAGAIAVLYRRRDVPAFAPRLLRDAHTLVRVWEQQAEQDRDRTSLAVPVALPFPPRGAS